MPPYASNKVLINTMTLSFSSIWNPLSDTVRSWNNQTITPTLSSDWPGVRRCESSQGLDSQALLDTHKTQRDPVGSGVQAGGGCDSRISSVANQSRCKHFCLQTRSDDESYKLFSLKYTEAFKAKHSVYSGTSTVDSPKVSKLTQ